MEQIISFGDTIVALSTPAGSGALALIRLSGPSAVETVADAWKGADLRLAASHTAHLGEYIGRDGRPLDQCVATIYRGPRSFTGEDMVEISVHGSGWIQRAVVNDLIERGLRPAAPGEFSQRAFLNGKIDLAQAEGIADLIGASSRAAHSLAIRQTKGQFSRKLDAMRDSLVELASLLELELDFSEEDVEFADRSRLSSLAEELCATITRLADSYGAGSVIKEGVNVVIAGIPNAGKSTLLNNLLGDDKAIVSDIAGTTRDVIEDTREIGGILFRFIDTAGLRESDDVIERIGIGRARERLAKASVVIWVIDVTSPLTPQTDEIMTSTRDINPDCRLILLLNKTDLPRDRWSFDFESFKDSLKEISESQEIGSAFHGDEPLICGSAGSESTAKEIENCLEKTSRRLIDREADVVITNARHYEALLRGRDALERVLAGLRDGLPADLIAQDLREATHHLGTITGSVTTDTLLQTIFSRFCIGK